MAAVASMTDDARETASAKGFWVELFPLAPRPDGFVDVELEYLGSNQFELKSNSETTRIASSNEQ